MIPSEISVSPEQVSAHLSALARALDELPSPGRLDDRTGGTAGLSHGFGHSLTDAATALRRQLRSMRHDAEHGAEAMRASVRALVAADELSEQDARALLVFLGSEETPLSAAPHASDGSV